LERGNVVSLSLDLVADREMGRVEPVHRGEPREDIAGNTVHDALVPAVNDRMQAAERAEPCRRSGAAEKPVALDQKGRPPAPASRERRRDAGGAAAEND